LIAEIRAEGKIVLPSDSQLKGGEETLNIPPGDTPESDLGIRIGETVYNLRTALDYAVHIISGERKSQFPLDDDCKNFEARKTGRLPNGKGFPAYLRGVPKREFDLIEAVQPCKGIDWSRRLRELSNRDKHRDFVVINATSGQPFTRKEIAALYPSPDLYPGDNVFPSAGQVEMHVEAPIDIAFADGIAVTKALDELKTKVGKLLLCLEGS
jgi:hypothetical protein